MINTDTSVNCMDPKFSIFKFYFHVLSFLVSQMVRVMAVIKLQRQKCVAKLTSLLTDFSSIFWLSWTLAYSVTLCGNSTTVILWETAIWARRYLVWMFPSHQKNYWGCWLHRSLLNNEGIIWWKLEHILQFLVTEFSVRSFLFILLFNCFT